MSQTKHTPGPWLVGKTRTKDGDVYIEEPNQNAIVATVHVCCGWEGANAALIAAAPEMLSQLKILYTYLSSSSLLMIGTREAADALYELIAKAEGGNK